MLRSFGSHSWGSVLGAPDFWKLPYDFSGLHKRGLNGVVSVAGTIIGF